MSLAEVKALLEQHQADPEVQAHLASLVPVTADGVKKFLADGRDKPETQTLVAALMTPDGVRGWLESADEGKKLAQSLTDKRVTDAVETYRQKTLPGLVQAEVVKLNPPKSEPERRIEAIEQELVNEKAARAREALKTRALGYIGQKALPAELSTLVDHLIGHDEETTDANLRRLEEAFAGALGKAVDARFKTDGTKPPPPTKDTGTAITREALKKMPRDQINKEYKAGNLDGILAGKT